jgi:hypothetical protein
VKIIEEKSQPFSVRWSTKKHVEPKPKSRKRSPMDVQDAITTLAKALKISETRLLDVLQVNGLIDMPVPAEFAPQDPIPLDPGVAETLVVFDALRSVRGNGKSVPIETVKAWRDSLVALQDTDPAHQPKLG